VAKAARGKCGYEFPMGNFVTPLTPAGRACELPSWASSGLPPCREVEATSATTVAVVGAASLPWTRAVLRARGTTIPRPLLQVPGAGQSSRACAGLDDPWLLASLLTGPVLRFWGPGARQEIGPYNQYVVIFTCIYNILPLNNTTPYKNNIDTSTQFLTQPVFGIPLAIFYYLIDMSYNL
jgi:hypothetical protein